MSVRLTSPTCDPQIGDDARTELHEKFDEAPAVYADIQSRLDGVRGYLLAADRSTQIEILRKAYVYAALTANTSVRFADEAYGRWLAGDDIRRAAYATPAIPHQRGGYLKHGLDHFESAVSDALAAINDRNWFRAAELIRASDDLKGLNRVKAHFAVALVGGRTACLDTHCERFVNRATDVTLDPNKMGDYRAAVQALETADSQWSPFMAQWIAFDNERGTVTSHQLFYDSLDLS
ncbi:hypothetical protein PN419_00425 [Halorubrum ezzemoulense]|uniref:hypothetical protein n=1 Tax=Halorubrum ezzemoulense TaxID=337243 RepID=UPI0023304792|nr:hypothetical protein [Halorubrum ezzemoulense]MDB9247472.1 hypothetical protein [Halorubrum ezzemoulense]MDB9258619.1 hypothetical protein [Halorubrum ezzemoulense]MDB9264523.1 hypothetical protein [Halorubrum ezzemoulense]MDB9268980.1 hypothetical protein [Halorubrum ezzemoulense]MDB9271491.1 hypothetical protein [Halorubrum ezzemoulense]